jgi:hypothetical protein
MDELIEHMRPKKQVDLDVMSFGSIFPDSIIELENLKNNDWEKFVCIPEDMDSQTATHHLLAVVINRQSKTQLAEFRTKKNRRTADEYGSFDYLYYVVANVDDPKKPIVLRYVKSSDEQYYDLRFTIVKDPGEKEDVIFAWAADVSEILWREI